MNRLAALLISLTLSLLASQGFAITVISEQHPAAQKALKNYDRAAVCFSLQGSLEKSATDHLFIKGNVTSVIKTDHAVPQTISVRVSSLEARGVEKELKRNRPVSKCYELVRKKGQPHYQFLGTKGLSELKKSPDGYRNSRNGFYKTGNQKP